MENISRRSLLKSLGLVTGSSLIGLPIFAQKENEESISKKLKIVVIGAHPDDAETFCGGTMALMAQAGHEVVSAYLTRGEAGIDEMSYDEAARIRTDEALKACKLLKARPEFIGQIDGSCEINKSRYKEMHVFLEKENPDIVFTHWPIDTHRDHRICSILVLDYWIYSGRKFELYYGEVMTGSQSQNFTPTEYVDISKVIKIKHDACFVHKSQKMEEEYPLYHGRMEVFRGMEYNCEYAEAFVKHFQSSAQRII